uniref:Ubiquitin hydrolase n=1 Tax=Tanacetum cinerariifolium TaxID=118510 RepID=A0A6L2N769_TANCI|nr:hypothetical protein [Tanacetum cinerariifolium]
MENLPPPNGNQNAPEEEPFIDQAPDAFDGFAPHWFDEKFSNINNGWIEWDVPLGGEVDEPMVDPEVNEEVMDDDDWGVEVEWLMAPVTPPRATMTVSSTYKVGGPSTAAIEGPSFPLPAPGLPVPPTEIEDLDSRLGNLEYRHGVLTRKMEEVSDAAMADRNAIGEIHPRVAIVGEQYMRDTFGASSGVRKEDFFPQNRMQWSFSCRNKRIGNYNQMVTSISIMGENKPSNQRRRLVEYKEREVKYIERIRILEMYKESNIERIKILTNEVETLKEEKDVVDGKLARLLKSSKDLENIIESQRSEKVKEGVGYNAVPPPPADLYLSPKKDLSWTGLPEFVDDTVTDYSRPSPTIESTSTEDQNKDTSTSEDVASTNPPKPFVKFVKPKDGQPESKSKEQETPKKSQVKYPEQNRHSNKRPKGNQRNWNNLKSYQLGPEFVLHKKPCFNYGDFSHLANDCRPNGAHMRPPLRSSGPRPHRDSMRPSFRPAGHRPHGPLMNPRRPTMNGSTKNHTADIGRKGKAVKPSACWTWNPSQELSNKVPRVTLMTKVIGTMAALGT